MPLPARLIVMLCTAALAFTALETTAEDRVSAEHGVAAGRDIRDTTITIGYTFEQVQALIQAGTQELKTTYQAQVKELSQRLEVTQDAVIGFFGILQREQVPPEKLTETLATIAQRHREMLDRLAVLDPEDPVTKNLIEQARAAIKEAEYDHADWLLGEAEAAELAAVRMAEELVRQAQVAADRRRLKAAATRSERAELSMIRLDYLTAAQHFKAASELVPSSSYEARGEYLRRHADALQQYGDEKGDNAVLRQAISAYQATLEVLTRDRVPLDWAGTQHNLGTALGILGERESGTARLEEAVAAYREALKESTRARVPLQWAMTQNNLGNAYLALGDETNAVTSFVHVLFVYPNYREAYETAHFLYHERLFEFDKAFALNQQWLEGHPGDLSAHTNFAETHFTTARFAAAKFRLDGLLARPELDPGIVIALRALELATLLALNETDTVAQKLEALHGFVAAQSAEITSGWTFAGSKHFVAHHERLASYPWLQDVLTAIEAQDWTTLLAILQTAKRLFTRQPLGIGRDHDGFSGVYPISELRVVT